MRSRGFPARTALKSGDTKKRGVRDSEHNRNDTALSAPCDPLIIRLNTGYCGGLVLLGSAGTASAGLKGKEDLLRTEEDGDILVGQGII